MRFWRQVPVPVLLLLGFAALPLGADPGDVESSRDYAAFPRLPGYIISDYDEDNPADFTFPVSRPQPIDSDHVESVAVRGHRYVIRYELNAGARAPTLLETQLDYEKMAGNAGFTVEKNGAVADSTETFHLSREGRDVWVYLVPGLVVNVLTVVESSGPAPAPPQALSAMPSSGQGATNAPPDTPALNSAPPDPPSAHPRLAPPNTTPSAPVENGGDSLYTDLDTDGRVVLPLAFVPGKAELAEDSQPQIDRVIAMMNDHPELSLRIEGHTDNTGDAEDNLRLSAERALAVQARLIAAHIDKKRLDAVGVGGLQPITSNNTSEGREQNRRIELVVWKRLHPFHASAPNGQNYYPGAGN